MNPSLYTNIVMILISNLLYAIRPYATPPQDKDDPSHTLGCSPPGFPTAEYINAHPELFSDWQPMNPTAIAIYHSTSYLAEILSCLALFIFVLWSLCKDLFRAMRSGYRMVPDRDTTQGSANL